MVETTDWLPESLIFLFRDIRPHGWKDKDRHVKKYQLFGEFLSLFVPISGQIGKSLLSTDDNTEKVLKSLEENQMAGLRC